MSSFYTTKRNSSQSLKHDSVGKENVTKSCSNPFAEEDHEQSDSNEPSLANSSVSSSSRNNNVQDRRFHDPFHTGHALQAAQSSLLDMTRDESQDDTGEISMDILERHASHPSPDASLLDDEDDDEVEEEDDFQIHTESFTVMERSIVNISESLSGSFCTLGNEIQNSCANDCTVASLSEKLQVKKMLFSDRIIQKRLMDDFHYLLGSSSQPCCAEKNLFLNCFASDFPVLSENDETSGHCQDKIRNRAGESWRARAYRIKRLREEKMMKETGFSKSVDFLVPMEQHKTMSRSSSFTHFSSQRVHSSRKPKQEVNVEPLGCMIGDCIEPISPFEDDHVELEWKSRGEYLDEQDLCYDSDPGIIMQSIANDAGDSGHMSKPNYKYERSKSCEVNVNVNEPQSPRKLWYKSPRRRRRKIHLDSFDGLLDSPKKSVENGDSGRAQASARMADSSFESCNSSNILLKKRDMLNPLTLDKDIQTYVQTSLNQTWTLTWHPPSIDGSVQSAKGESQSASLGASAKHTSSPSPRCIQVWFERGNRVRKNDIIEPKLMWRDAYHPDLWSQRKLNKSTTQGPHQVCLLSICRIIEAKSLDRNKYPFAKNSCSFIIRTSDDAEFVFEAGNQHQRDYVVHMWKLVIARLASQAVVGDGEGMIGEFFVPSSFGVP